MKEQMLVLDLETTGLDPRNDEILEVGAIRVDHDLNLGWEQSWVVMPRDLRMPPVVYEMHTKNGLLAELPRGLPLDEVELLLLDRLLPIPGKIRLAGNSVHFDLEFVRAHMPLLAERLSHRIMDCSTLRDSLRLWRPDIQWPEGGGAHRALADCHDSLSILRQYRAVVRDLGKKETV